MTFKKNKPITLTFPDGTKRVYDPKRYGYNDEPDWFKIIGGTVAVVVLGGVIAYAIWDEATEPLDGTVSSKEYQEPYDYPTESCTTTNKVTSCYTTWHHVDECWYVEYEHTDEKGIVTTGDDCTTETIYNALQIGDHYTQDG